MSSRAIGNLKRNPSSIERKRLPGIANVCKLKINGMKSRSEFIIYTLNTS